MSEPWVVLKFGGTSVAGRLQWDAIARLARARREAGHRALIVCSALEGVTDALENMADGSGSTIAIDRLMARHAELAAELEIDAADILRQGRDRLEGALSACRNDPGPARLAALLGSGEWLSTQLGARFLASKMEAGWVDVLEALEARPEPDPDSARAWLSARCEAFPDPALQEDLAAREAVLVTQGFLVRSPAGGTALLGRGGSDTSAALLGSRLQAERVEIWTDVCGLYSSDPRLEPRARRIPAITYAEAQELAAGGARVIHGRSIRAAAAAGIPLWIRNLAATDEAGTVISAQAPDAPGGIRAVTCQPRMAVLLLENLDTRQQVGFLAGVFGAIAGQGVSVDLVATSETTTTLAIDREANHLEERDLETIAEALSGLCRVDVFADCSCVNLVGGGARTALARMGTAAEFFNERPLLMMSHSANDLSISLLVHAADAPPLMRLLHDALVLQE